MVTNTPPYALSLFSDVRLRGPDGDVDRVLVNAKAIGLLTYLSLPTVGRYVRRDLLVGLLWPELEQTRARTALRKTAHTLRKIMGRDILLSRGEEDIALSPALIWCDAAQFSAASDAGFLVAAMELYRGELMPGFHLPECWEFDRWLEVERTAARERAAAVAWALAQRLETAQHLSDAAGMARQSVRLSWSDERALRRAITMLERLGDRAGALRLFDEFARRLSADLNTTPSHETLDLANRLRSGAG